MKRLLTMSLAAVALVAVLPAAPAAAAFPVSTAAWCSSASTRRTC
ncbi:hypothetical protein [Dactylosporangium matsuzakiense]|nr:hypothetical protein [Dactylosporangium matsuzakiense]